MTTEPTTQATDTTPQETTALLPAPGGWVTTSDLAHRTGRSTEDIDTALRQAATDRHIVDGSLLAEGGAGTWHRPTSATVARHRIVSGRLGSGKTYLLRTFWAVEHDDPAINTWVCDPLPTLDAATTAQFDRYAAGRQASIGLFTEACEAIDLRAAVANGRAFQATADAPQVIVTVDHADYLLEDPQAERLLERIALTGRSAGFVLRLAITPGTRDVLGGTQLWRSLNQSA